MVGENRGELTASYDRGEPQLITNEPVEFENEPVEVSSRRLQEILPIGLEESMEYTPI